MPRRAQPYFIGEYVWLMAHQDQAAQIKPAQILQLYRDGSADVELIADRTAVRAFAHQLKQLVTEDDGFCSKTCPPTRIRPCDMYFWKDASGYVVQVPLAVGQRVQVESATSDVLYTAEITRTHENGSMDIKLIDDGSTYRHVNAYQKTELCNHLGWWDITAAGTPCESSRYDLAFNQHQLLFSLTHQPSSPASSPLPCRPPLCPRLASEGSVQGSDEESDEGSGEDVGEDVDSAQEYEWDDAASENECGTSAVDGAGFPRKSTFEGTNTPCRTVQIYRADSISIGS